MIGCLGDKVETFLGYTDVGSQFVYGYLAMDIIDGEGAFIAASVFYFKTLSVIFFFSFMVSMLFYAGVMQGCCESSIFFEEFWSYRPNRILGLP